jgi:prepilin-type N-terminal cleavage/methylation domain-containing protein
MRNVNGFSLVELMIVIAILAIVSSIGVFSYRKYVSSQNLRTVARGIEADIKKCKQDAVTQNGNITMTFSVAGNNYTIAGLTKSPTSFGSDTGSGININTDFTLTCQPRGTFSPTTGSITITNSIGSTGVITFNVTGRTYVTFTM